MVEVIEQENVVIECIKETGTTDLIEASFKNQFEKVKNLLNEKNIDVNVKSDHYFYTPLIVASKDGYFKIVKILLETEGVDVNSKNKHGITSLYYSLLKQNLEITELLLRNGADLCEALEKIKIYEDYDVLDEIYEFVNKVTDGLVKGISRYK